MVAAVFVPVAAAAPARAVMLSAGFVREVVGVGMGDDHGVKVFEAFTGRQGLNAADGAYGGTQDRVGENARTADLHENGRVADERQAFGGPLRQFQAVSHRLADMAVAISAARLLVIDAAAAHDRGERATRQAAMAKLFATEMAQQTIDGAIQIHGASGLQRGHLLEELYREVRALRIYEGTSEIQRSIIARELYRDHPGDRR